eukprot:9870691-Karenia_brevis.AAC.1
MGTSIPKALTNDSFIGYANEVIVKETVNLLEATIACPIFTGLTTYYMEDSKHGTQGVKGN